MSALRPRVWDVADESGFEVEFREHVTVELVRASAQDADVLFAARVSTKGEQSLEDVGADASRSKGLLNYLMRDRHGCYDEQTEVLTRHGWRRWPEVTGAEEFATRSPDGWIEYQRAQRLIAEPYDGPMLRIVKAHVDLLVTPAHRIYAQRRRQPHRQRWALVPATDMRAASHRLAMGGGLWSDDLGLTMPRSWFALLGFFIGDGSTASPGSMPVFRLRKRREIEFLRLHAAALGWELRPSGADRWHLVADEDFRLFAKKCYDVNRAKTIPAEVLHSGPEQLAALLEGLMASDGGVSPAAKQTYVTASPLLAGQIQEVALKTGAAATIHEMRPGEGGGHYGAETVYRVTLCRKRNLHPRVGWTAADRASEVDVEHYSGRVYCVTVPNGTLYVRRGGIPAWCGNSPFEHNSMTFYVQAPIFVFREFMRHRIASYNEESGRYRELRPVFYRPGPDRRLVQVGKPGAYTFEDGTPEQHALVTEQTEAVCREAYAAYQRMLAAGVAREVARIVLPLTLFSSMYVTMNARALMNFLALRTSRDNASFPSFPQREIEMVAERMEAEWAALMPLTHAAFETNGRVAP